MTFMFYLSTGQPHIAHANSRFIPTSYQHSRMHAFEGCGKQRSEYSHCAHGGHNVRVALSKCARGSGRPQDEALTNAYGVRLAVNKSATVEELGRAFGRIPARG